MWIVRLALRRPYTFVVLSLLILLLGLGTCVEAPKDIYPYIDIPVVTMARLCAAGERRPRER
jgi:multidrug efflux pump subunit AcrB